MIPTRIGQIFGEYMFVGVMPYKGNAYALFQSKFTHASRSVNTPKFSKSPRLPIAPEIKPVVATPAETAVIMCSTIGLLNPRLIDVQTFQFDKSHQTHFHPSFYRHCNYVVSFSLRYNKEWFRPWAIGAIARASSVNNDSKDVRVEFCISSQFVRIKLKSEYNRQCAFLPLVKVPIV